METISMTWLATICEAKDMKKTLQKLFGGVSLGAAPGDCVTQ